MIEVIFDPDDITIHACSSIQLDYSTDEDGKPSVSHDDGGEGVSLEEEKSRMVLLLGSLNKMIGRTRPLATAPGTCCLGYLHFSCRTDHTPILTLRSMHVSLIALMLNKKTFQGQTFKLCEPLAWGPD